MLKLGFKFSNRHQRKLQGMAGSVPLCLVKFCLGSLELKHKGPHVNMRWLIDDWCQNGEAMMSNIIDAVGQSNPTDNSWQSQWDEILKEMKNMSAQEALMFIMYQVLPEVGDFMQSNLGDNANTQNDLSQIIGDMSDIQDQFNQYNSPDGITTQDAQDALNDYNDIQSVLADSGSSLSGISTALIDQLKPLFSGGSASDIASDWSKAWKESTVETGSSADDSAMTSYTDAFSESNSTATGESQTIQSEAQYIGNQLQEFFGEEGNITSSENSGVTVMVNNENTN